jgi:SAM-dependent methyltransferase
MNGQRSGALKLVSTNVETAPTAHPSLTSCRICRSKNLELAVDLGLQPWGNHFLKASEVGREPFYPLRVVFCNDCSLAQLDHTVPKEVMFGDHTYLSGVTRSLNQHFKSVASTVDSRFFSERKQKSALDIGSNDGTQLRHFRDLGYEILGVESSKTTAKVANDLQTPTLNEFFNAAVATRLDRHFDVINASGIFFHLEELQSVTEGIKTLLAKDGVFVVQFLYMKKIMENCAFDQIYHEHLLYYTLATINRLLAEFQLEMFDAEEAAIHGGSIVGYVGHKGTRPVSPRLKQLHKREADNGVNKLSAYKAFTTEIAAKKEQNLRDLHKMKSRGLRIYGMGAPVKGNTLLNYFAISTDLVSCLVEINPLRKGLFAPGSHIPIVMEEAVAKDPPDVYYVLAWNFKREILARHRELVRGGTQFYFPVDDGS